MLKNFIPLIDWSMGVIGAIFMFAIFGVLFIWLLLKLRKKN